MESGIVARASCPLRSTASARSAAESALSTVVAGRCRRGSTPSASQRRRRCPLGMPAPKCVGQPPRAVLVLRHAIRPTCGLPGATHEYEGQGRRGNALAGALGGPLSMGSPSTSSLSYACALDGRGVASVNKTLLRRRHGGAEADAEADPPPTMARPLTHSLSHSLSTQEACWAGLGEQGRRGRNRLRARRSHAEVDDTTANQ